MNPARLLSPDRITVVLALAGVLTWSAALLTPRSHPPAAWSADQLRTLASLMVPEGPPPSPSNRYADDPRAAALGAALFSDTRLSGAGDLACTSCHDPALDFTDGRPVAVGAARGTRNTPSVVGAAHAPFLHWDGRKDSLWSQALAPIESPTEMAGHRLEVARLVRDIYAAEFELVFGPLPDDAESWGTRHGGPPGRGWEALDPRQRGDVDRVFAQVGKAIAAFERGLQPAPAPFDRFVAALLAGDGSGGGHLSAAAERGLHAFLGSAGCVHCHNGPLFTDQAFHRTLPGAARGRAEGIELLLRDPFRSDGVHSDGVTADLMFLDVDAPDMEGAFKTPSLRLLARTAPYGHDGRFRDLRELLESYRQAHTQDLDPVLATTAKDFDVDDMLAFLAALDGGERR